MLAAYRPAAIALALSSRTSSSRSSPLSSTSRSCGTSSLRTNSRVVLTISSCSSLRRNSTGAPSGRGLAALARDDRRDAVQRPIVQQLQVQPQLADLPLGRPVGAVRHRTRRDAVDEGHERAQYRLLDGGRPARELRPAARQTAL